MTSSNTQGRESGECYEGYVGDLRHVWNFGNRFLLYHFDADGVLVSVLDTLQEPRFDPVVIRKRFDPTSAIAREKTGWWIKENRA